MSLSTSGRRYAATPHAYDVGLLLLRLSVGPTMAANGAQKLFGWFGGSGISGTSQYFATSGYPSAHALAIVAGLSELLGGLGLAVGLLTPLAGAAIVGTLVNAVAVVWGKGFFAPGGIELPLTILVAAASLSLTGPGGYALDRFLPFLRSHRLAYGAAAVAVGLVVAAAVLLLRK